MANLNGQNIGSNYKGLLNLDATTINTPLDATLRAVTDGMGTSSVLQLATEKVAFGSFTGAATGNILWSANGTLTEYTGWHQSDGEYRFITKNGSPVFFNIAYGINFNNGFGSTGKSAIDANGNWSIGGSITNAARLHVRGSGATSATTSLLVENSAGSAAFQVKDNQQVQINLGDTLVSAATPNLTFSSSQTGIYAPNPNQLGITCYGNETARFVYGSALHNGALNIGKFANPGNTAFFGWCSDGSLEITGNAQSVFINPTNNSSLVIGASTAQASAILQADSTTKGFLPPRMTTAQINAISTPAAGLQVYNTDLLQPCFYDGTGWRKVSHSVM